MNNHITSHVGIALSAKLDEITPDLQNILMAYPVRVPVKWFKKSGKVVIVYPKNLSRFERGLQKYIGGPEVVRRTMDEKGTLIWELCDGRHTIKDIVDVMDARYREEIEPVFEFVHKVILMLLERNLLTLEKAKPERPLPYRKQRVLKKH